MPLFFAIGPSLPDLDVSPEVVKLLVEHGANVNARCPNGDSLLLEALATGQEWIAKLLLEHGADINAKDEHGRTPLIAIADGASWNYVRAGHRSKQDIVQQARFLLDNGADIYAQDKKGRTALMAAVERDRDSELVTLLLDRGADMDIRDKNGRTALRDPLP